MFKMEAKANVNILGIKTSFMALYAEPNFMTATTSQLLWIKHRAGEWSTWRSHVIHNSMQYTPYGPLDAISGGTYDVQQELYESIDSGGTPPLNIGMFDLGFVRLQSQVFDRTHGITFIPTVSSIAYPSNMNWNQTINPQDAICNDWSPFDNLFIPLENEKHVKLTEGNVNWVMQEIDKGSNPCPEICVTEILGNGDMHIGDTRTFTLNNSLPTGATTTWNAASNFQIISSTNTSVTVTKIGPTAPLNIPFLGTYYWGILFAKISQSCSADLYLGKMISNTQYKSSDTTNKYSELYNFNEMNELDALHVGDIKNNYSGSMQPNPTNTNWVLKMNTNNNENVQIKLVDISGKTLWSAVKNASESIHIPGNNLASGMYFVHVISGDKTYNYKVELV
jgi:hypothetical protein